MGVEAAPVGPSSGGSAAKPQLVQADQPPPKPSPREGKIAAFRAEHAARLAATAGEQPAAPATTPPPPEKTAAPADPKTEAPADPAKKPEDEAPDPQTAKALEAIQKRDQRAREQLEADKRAARAELDKERAELERLRAELTGKSTPLDDLKKLPATKRAIEALKLAGIDPDDEDTMDVIARETYARSKSGKADPRNRAYADQVAEKHAASSDVAELRKTVEDLKAELAQRDQRVRAETFANRYLDEAVKAIPSDPTFISRALAANPERARAALLAIGQHLEKQNGETPTHAEVIAAYEEAAKQDLRDRGFTAEQIAAILGASTAAPAKTTAPATAAAAPKAAPSTPAMRTLDPSTGPTTPTLPQNATRQQKIDAARAARLKTNVAP